MKPLFVCANELAAFKARHPEYNKFVEVKDKYGELAGYDVYVVDEEEVDKD